MIIICPCGEKKFEVNESLIPSEGRELKCGSCDETWFFKKPIKKEVSILEEKHSIDKKISPKNFKPKANTHKIDNNFENDIKNQPNKKRSIGILNFILVFIISGIALIILVDTFKVPISFFIPNIEFILYNLYESLIDIILFLKDLS